MKRRYKHAKKNCLGQCQLLVHWATNKLLPTGNLNQMWKCFFNEQHLGVPFANLFKSQLLWTAYISRSHVFQIYSNMQNNINRYSRPAHLNSNVWIKKYWFMALNWFAKTRDIYIYKQTQHQSHNSNAVECHTRYNACFDMHYVFIEKKCSSTFINIIRSS